LGIPLVDTWDCGFIGIEIDPNYHKISVDRLNGITTNGQTSIFTDFEVLSHD